MKLLITEETFVGLVSAREERQGVERLGREAPPVREFGDEQIASCTNMGFSRNLSIRALERAFGNVEMAVDLLLNDNVPRDGLEEEIKEASEADVVMEDEEDKNEEDKKEEDKKEEEDKDKDAKEEDKEKDVKEEDQKEDVKIPVKNYKQLSNHIKEWLKRLFDWILDGFNSSLTDLDVENITQFMLKYVTSDEEVNTLMIACKKEMKVMKGYLLEEKDKDKKDYQYQKDRRGCLKKLSTLTRILASLCKYLPKNSVFFGEIVNSFIDLLGEAGTSPLDFIPKETEYQIGDMTDVEPAKSEYQIFKDIIDNFLKIVV